MQTLEGFDFAKKENIRAKDKFVGPFLRQAVDSEKLRWLRSFCMKGGHREVASSSACKNGQLLREVGKPPLSQQIYVWEYVVVL